VTQSERTRKNLAEILDRLGPGLLLKVDDSCLSRAFGFVAIGSNAGARHRAEQFAEDRECFFLHDAKTSAGMFGRTYARVPDNAGRVKPAGK
jgi:hypothetical protein